MAPKERIDNQIVTVHIEALQSASPIAEVEAKIQANYKKLLGDIFTGEEGINFDNITAQQARQVFGELLLGWNRLGIQPTQNPNRRSHPELDYILNDNEIVTIIERYGLDNGNMRTQEEIGLSLGKKTNSWASIVELRAMRKLRHPQNRQRLLTLSSNW